MSIAGDNIPTESYVGASAIKSEPKETTLFQKPVIKPASRANLFFHGARDPTTETTFFAFKKVTTRANFVKLLIG